MNSGPGHECLCNEPHGNDADRSLLCGTLAEATKRDYQQLLSADLWNCFLLHGSISGCRVFEIRITGAQLYGRIFYEAFEEEEEALRRHLGPALSFDFTSRTIQEAGHMHRRQD